MRRGPIPALVAAVATLATGTTFLVSGLTGVPKPPGIFGGSPGATPVDRPKWVTPDGSAGQPVTTAEKPAPPGSPAPRPLLHAAPVNASSPGFWSWALLDLTTGSITGSPNLHAQSDTASLVKAWIGADHLRRAAERKTTPGRDTLAKLSIMIRDSDNATAIRFHAANGGSASIKRMISICRLTDSAANSGGWSTTRISARDVARLAACVADGRAAGAAWTGWLLTEMRQVRGPGRFGVIQVLPPAAASGAAIKNGWLLREDGQWHISCLAVGDGWALGVLARYPGRLGKAHGERLCRSVGQQLMA